MIARLRSWLAYRSFQRKAKAAIRSAQASHGKVSEIRARQQAILHAALAGRGE